VPAVDQGHNLKNFNGFPNSTKIRATAILSAKGCKRCRTGLYDSDEARKRTNGAVRRDGGLVYVRIRGNSNIGAHPSSSKGNFIMSSYHFHFNDYRAEVQSPIQTSSSSTNLVFPSRLLFQCRSTHPASSRSLTFEANASLSLNQFGDATDA
jgi:hypothetical protein